MACLAQELQARSPNEGPRQTRGSPTVHGVACLASWEKPTVNMTLQADNLETETCPCGTTIVPWSCLPGAAIQLIMAADIGPLQAACSIFTGN